MRKKVVLLIVMVLLFAWAVMYAVSDKTLAGSAAEPELVDYTFTLYYGDRELVDLITEERTVAVKDGTNPVKVALEQLTLAPQNKAAVVLMPLETEVLDVTVEGDVVTINFNDCIVKNFYGGSASEAMLITSIVNTVTDIEGYDGRKVQFVIDGEIVESIGGHIGTEDPFERNDE
ncbi:MAG: GerMN domain-containing protein [Firmicutes bacterium]|nr:GerMN domain-containing protein [Bacillota bacterium]